MENDYAVSLFDDHVRKLDELPWEARQEHLIVYLLAGNMFDWGAKEVATLLENKNNNFGFEQALEKIPSEFKGGDPSQIISLEGRV